MKDYKRLTKRGVNGRAYYATPFTSNSMQAIYEEDVKKKQDVMERLCDFEDKIENGTLVDCPYKLGTELHFIVLNKHSGEFEIFTTEFWAYVSRYKDEFGGVEFAIEIIDVDFDNDTLIEVCHFLTKPEAEAKLRELKEKDNGQR